MIYALPLFRKFLHSRPVTHAIARLLGPRGCGQIMGLLLLPYVSKTKTNVLALSRELLSKDIEQVDQRTDINFIPWRSGHMGRFLEVWTPTVCQTQTNFIPEEKYLNHPCWTKGVTLLTALVSVLEKRGRVSIAMTANIDYWQEESLRRFCADSHVKHLVLNRENHMVKEYSDLMRSEHASADFFKFDGYAAVFSQSMKDLVIETTGCNPDHIIVTGAPRMDMWLDERSTQTKDLVTFLSFHTSTIEGMFDEAIEVYIETARKFPDLEFVVKCKEGRGDFGRMEQLFIDRSAPKNLRPEQYIGMRDLMDRSRVIVGFNTLSLAEALLTDAPIIIPSWRVTTSDNDRLMMHPDDKELAEVVHFPHTLDEFRTELESAISTPETLQSDARLKLVNRYMMFTPNESASTRVAALIEKLAAS